MLGPLRAALAAGRRPLADIHRHLYGSTISDESFSTDVCFFLP